MSTVSGECPKIWEFRECLIRTTSSIPALHHTRKKNNLQLRNWFAMQRNSAEGQIYRLIIGICRVIPNLLCSYTFLCISGHSSKATIFFFFVISTQKSQSYLGVMISSLEIGTVQFVPAAAPVTSAQSNGKETGRFPHCQDMISSEISLLFCFHSISALSA